ncbi:hypothetical protein [Azospirillum halopraeferens]|uniref:hypothetical protein n=1 Tax=Azospirillum halopraeferens TaxID=34010 RepID=UPI00040A89AE|nr:hypothetical protein [Azospirillum halopraeferens]
MQNSRRPGDGHRFARTAAARAVCDNFRFEERVTDDRWAAYDTHDFEPPPTRPRRTMAVKHADYVANRLNAPPDGVPATFTADNADALIATLAPRDIIRVECIDWLFDRVGRFTKPNVLNAFRMAKNRGRAPTDPVRLTQNRLLEAFVERWNRRRDNRPGFAAFRDEVKDDLEDRNWFLRLRDRLGLGHFHVPNHAKEYTVVAMAYTVAEVLEATPRAERQRAFAVPTVLDGPLNPFYVPAPTELPYGRTLDLREDAACNRLVAEILHRRIDYSVAHMEKMASIAAPMPEPSLKRLRNAHLRCLREYRSDFGEPMPDHVRD